MLTSKFLFSLFTISVNCFSFANLFSCGIRPLDLKGRIIGGKEAWFGQVPWQSLLVMSRLFGLIKYPTCGGVLISDRWIVTAAHCNPGWLGSMQVIIGTIDNYKRSQKSIVRRIKRVFIHPKFNRFRYENDIALIELKTKVRFSDNIQPICLPEENEDFKGKLAVVSGWGHTKFGSHQLPVKLQVVHVPILNREECHEMFQKAGFKRIFPKSTLCAGYHEGKKDSCTGDSGGPLMLQRKDSSWVLVGIVSNGIKCAEPNLPGIYTKVSSYTKWIKEIIGYPSYLL